MPIGASRLLPARCLDATRGFYAPLGFETLFREDLPGGYLVMRREAATLPFVRQRRCVSPGDPVCFRINVDDLEQCHADWRAVLTASAAQRLGEICTTAAGREFALLDLDGTSLRVCQRQGATSRTAAPPVE
jgi:hypothetical protein